MKLYGAPWPAPNPRRVRMFLAEKGIPLAETPVDLAAREHKSDDFRAMNSLGQIPVLELDDGTAISETIAICRYFEETRPEPPLFGRTAIEKALVDMWVRRIEFILMNPVGNYWRHAHPRTAALLTQYRDFGESNAAAYASAQAWLDGELAKREFVAGAEFTIADICLISTVDFAKWIGLPIDPKNGHLAVWHERMQTRPTYRA